MAPLDGYLEDPEYSNWVKCGLALNITNEVLRPFVVKEITELHQSIVKKLPSGVCGGCRVNTGCPKYICDKIQHEIEIQHWYGKPSFTNTCTGRWSTGPWEIAKCYMPPSKGSRCSSDSDADFTASINVIINCKHFQAFGTNDPNGTPKSNLSKSRDFRNSIMHASPQKVSNHYMKENLDILINIINMVKAPETKAEVEESIKGIEKIKTDQLKLKFEDVIEVRKNATEAIADKTEKQSEQVQRERMLVNFEAGCRKALCRFTEEHISKQEENLSVADFLSKIRIFAVVKDLCSSHKEMLFPRKGTQKDIREWDLFVYCFILEELDVSEPLEEAVCNFVRVVKTIRDKLLVDATAVTQNDLSELCEYLIDTDLNTEITHIFNKDSSNVDVIHSNNILVSWWREEEDYGKKQVSKKQLNNYKHIMEEMDKFRQEIRVKVRDIEEHVTLQGANAAEIGAECELKVTGCDKKTEKALQKDITSPNINGGEKMKALNYFRDQRNLLEVNPEEGSIILKVTCSSTTNVLDFWDSCIDGRAVEALSKVRDYYRRYFKCDTLEFDVILTKKGVARCVNERVRGLSSQLEGLTHKVTDKVHDILESKDKELIQWSGEDSSDEDISGSYMGSESESYDGRDGSDSSPCLSRSESDGYDGRDGSGSSPCLSLEDRSTRRPVVVHDAWDDVMARMSEGIDALSPEWQSWSSALDSPTVSYRHCPATEGIDALSPERQSWSSALDSPTVSVRDCPATDEERIPGSDKDPSVIDEGSAIWSSSSEKPSLSLPRVIDGEREEEERIKQGVQIKYEERIPGSDKDPSVIDEGSAIWSSSSEKPSLSLPRVIDGERKEEERIKQGVQIKCDSVCDVDNKSSEDIDRLVMVLKRISEDNEEGSVASSTQHLRDIIHYSKKEDEKMVDECNMRFQNTL